MGKRKPENKLNDLSGKEWIKFQKSWFVKNPPARESELLVHPAKFPEELAGEFIRFFTKKGQTVLDPMAGTGSALIAALACGRKAVGIELSEKYAEIARERIAKLEQDLFAQKQMCRIYCADAADIATLKIPKVDYIITSPPYWDMLHAKGAKTQKKRRADKKLDVTYSADPRDLGNIHDYDEFMSRLMDIYREVAEYLRPNKYMTVIVKNVKKGGKIYPLAWDIGREVGKFLALKDERIWCQDNQRLAPFGIYNAWVSNTHHHYCLQFRKEG